jgi:hypothetical protein
MDDQEALTPEEYVEVMLAAQALRRALRGLSVDAWGTLTTGVNIMAEAAHRVPEALSVGEDGQW